MSTVDSVRKASQENLTDDIIGRIGLMSSLGTGAIEIKSGYGLTTEDELKMLRAIHDAAQNVSQAITGTFLGAHAIDPKQTDFIKKTTTLFKKAIDLGCPIRAHVDQFNSLGMLEEAIELGATSVDHLETSTDGELKKLAKSNSIGVLLPASGFCLGTDYARGREMIDFGCAIAIATNCNPGSAPMPSMPFAISLACRRLGLTPAEAITASTYNAACVLGVQENIGSLEVGKQANWQLLECEDERELGWQVASGGPLLIAINGEIDFAIDGDITFEDES